MWNVAPAVSAFSRPCPSCFETCFARQIKRISLNIWYLFYGLLWIKYAVYEIYKSLHSIFFLTFYTFAPTYADSLIKQPKKYYMFLNSVWMLLKCFSHVTVRNFIPSMTPWCWGLAVSHLAQKKALVVSRLASVWKWKHLNVTTVTLGG